MRIELGKRAAHLNIQIVTENGKPLDSGATLVFSRPDQFSSYSRRATNSEVILVPPVPFRITVKADGYKAWHYSGSRNGLIQLKSGEKFDILVRLEKLP
jgi:hypothetical protein